MYKKTLSLIFIVLVFGFSSQVFAAGADEEEIDIEIPSAGSNKPVLDGVVDEVWSLATKQEITITVEGDDPDSPEDCSGTWQALWDSEYLYVLIDITDEALVMDSGADSGWDDDRVEVFIDADNSKGESTDGVNDYQYNFRWNNAIVEIPVEWYFRDSGINKLEGVEYVVVTTETGYLFEIALPWSTMTGEPPQAGQLIGIDVMVDDDDDGGGRDTQLSWHIEESPPHSPVKWGTAFLTSEFPGKAIGPSPKNGQIEVPRDVVLSWIEGIFADKHNIYFGIDFNDVNEASIDDQRGVLVNQNQEESTYDPDGLLDYNQTYYWRIDEVNDLEPNSPWKGNVWYFQVLNYATVVDDFEDYNDYPPNEIFMTWVDGYGNANNGSTAGYPAPDFVAGEHYMEDKIVHGGQFSMPLFYDNSAGIISEVTRSFEPTMRNWTSEGVTKLGIWFKGHPATVGSFTEGPAGTYTMTGSGADIWDNSDEFHYAYKKLSGAGSITAKVESLVETNSWAKAGVMIRNSLDPDSRHAMMIVSPTQGVSYQRRTSTGGASNDTTEADITAPQWVKLERTLTNSFIASYSADGSSWTRLDSVTINMSNTVYIGLAVTAHNNGATCEAVFSNVSMTGNISQEPWANQDIGIISNIAEPMYVALNGNAVVYHDDPDAALLNDWTLWKIDLQEFANQGVNLNSVNTMTIGFGDRENPTAGGEGLVFFDDIRLYLPD